jgi:ABC-type transport system involved in cytochrome bd biosynthesis fused ATPase/permease subunit
MGAPTGYLLRDGVSQALILLLVAAGVGIAIGAGAGGLIGEDIPFALSVRAIAVAGAASDLSRLGRSGHRDRPDRHGRSVDGAARKQMSTPSVRPESTVPDREAGGDGGGGLVMRDVSLRFGDGDDTVLALDGVTLTVGPGEFVAMVGPSGAGKSSLLAVAGD